MAFYAGVQNFEPLHKTPNVRAKKIPVHEATGFFFIKSLYVYSYWRIRGLILFHRSSIFSSFFTISSLLSFTCFNRLLSSINSGANWSRLFVGSLLISGVFFSVSWVTR